MSSVRIITHFSNLLTKIEKEYLFLQNEKNYTYQI